MQNVLKMNIDFKIKNYFNVIAQQNDDLIIIANVFDNGVPANLNGCSVIVNYVNANNTIANIAGGNISFKDNLITIVCPRDCTRSYGTANMQITIVSSNKQVSSFPIGVKVNAGVIQGQETSKNVVTITEELNNASVEALKAKTGVVDATKVAKSNMEEVQKTYVGATELARKVEQHSSQLEKKANKKDLRIFKPIFGANLFGEPCVDCNTIDEQKELFDKFKNIGIETSSLCIELIQNSSGDLEIKNVRGILDDVINYIVTNNIEIPVIHVYENYDSLTYGEDFKTKWVNGIKLILDKVKNINYTYMCVWNENTGKLYSQYVKDGVLGAYEEVRKVGKKAGIALGGIDTSFRIDDEYLNKADFIAFNFYPQVSNKKMGTSIEDGIKAWQNNGLSEWLKYIEMKYPEKDILLTESGVLDYWSALANPEGWGFNWYDSDTTGKVMEIFYTGLLETLKDTRIKYVFLWYPKSFIKFPAKMKELLNKYLGGVIK